MEDIGKLQPVLKELGDVTLMTIFERWWKLDGVSQDCKKENVPPVFKKDKMEDPGKYGLVTPNSVHRWKNNPQNHIQRH